jgi:Mitochondrial ribosomal protein (VAR1)
LSALIKEENTIINTSLISTNPNNYKASNKTLSNYKQSISALKHYSPAIKEWNNSIYVYNHNDYLKLLPAMDKTVYNLLKAYFNLNPSLTHNTNSSKIKKLNLLSMIKIFIGRPETKHNNNKVTINIYTYNRKKIYFLTNMKKLLSKLNLTEKRSFVKRLLFFKKRLEQKNKFFFNHLKNKSASFLFSYLANRLDNTSSSRLKNSIKSSVLEMSHSKQEYNKSNYTLSKLAFVDNKKFNVDSQNFKIQYILKLINFKVLKTNLIKWAHKNITFFNQLKKISTNKSLFYKDISLNLKKGFSYKYYSSMLYFNSYIFNTNNILPLKDILRKMYNKKIELNIIDLKYLYLDSNIFAEAITRKLKDRQKRVLRVLKLSLNLTKKPYFKIHFHKENVKVNFMFCDKKLDIKIKSNALALTNDTRGLANTSFGQTNRYLIYKPHSHKMRLFLYHMKQKIISGIKLQGTGRLTKRLTASRSISKVKYMGSLKNINSSYENISTIMLRGFVKSNLQYTNINNYNRNGSFGVKVSISVY